LPSGVPLGFGRCFTGASSIQRSSPESRSVRTIRRGSLDTPKGGKTSARELSHVSMLSFMRTSGQIVPKPKYLFVARSNSSTEAFCFHAKQFQLGGQDMGERRKTKSDRVSPVAPTFQIWRCSSRLFYHFAAVRHFRSEVWILHFIG
jgi:hypothetical protein